MKKYLYFIIVAFTLSCESNVDEKSNNIASKIIELTEEEFISIAYDDNVELLENHIIDIVQDFVASENLPENRIAHTRSTDLSITIKEKNYLKFKSMNTRTIANTDNSIEVPIFNVSVRTEKSNNIALVSGDERLPVIIAYYNDEFTDSCNLDNNILLNYSQQMLYRDLCYMENVRDSLHNPTIFKISQILNIPTDEIKFENIKSQIVIKEVGTNTRAAMIVDPVGSGSLLASFGPLCRVKWNVGMPYNRTMPQTCPNNWLWDNRYAISSVVLATAQAMSFYKPSMFVYGQSINWDYLRENEEIHEYTDYFGEYVADPIERRNMVANLLKYIGEQCSVSYTCSGSSVNFSNVINFINRYGLTIDGR